MIYCNSDNGMLYYMGTRLVGDESTPPVSYTVGVQTDSSCYIGASSIYNGVVMDSHGYSTSNYNITGYGGSIISAQLSSTYGETAYNIASEGLSATGVTFSGTTAYFTGVLTGNGYVSTAMPALYEKNISLYFEKIDSDLQTKYDMVPIVIGGLGVSGCIMHINSGIYTRHGASNVTIPSSALRILESGGSYTAGVGSDEVGRLLLDIDLYGTPARTGLKGKLSMTVPAYTDQRGHQMAVHMNKAVWHPDDSAGTNWHWIKYRLENSADIQSLGDYKHVYYQEYTGRNYEFDMRIPPWYNLY